MQSESLLQPLPVAKLFLCSVTPSCGLWHRDRRRPAGTTPATPPQHLTSGIQMPCPPASGEGEKRIGERLEEVQRGNRGKGKDKMQGRTQEIKRKRIKPGRNLTIQNG